MSPLRPFAFVGLGYLALLLQASLGAALGTPWHLPTPDLMLLVVLYLGLRGRGALPQLVGVALACGYLADLFAGSPRGLEAVALAVIVLTARAASNRLMVDTAWQVVAVAAAGAAAHATCVYLLASLYSEAPGSLRVVPSVALVSGLLAPVVFSVLRRLDRKLLLDPSRLSLSGRAR